MGSGVAELPDSERDRNLIRDDSEGLPERFTLNRFIGEGAMKRVYRAYDRLLEREVAIAVVPASQRERYRVEVQANGVISDRSHIVAIYDLALAPNRIFIVQQYMDGGNLADLIRAAQPSGLDADTVVRIAGDVVLGLEAAHADGVSHCDLKPSNVLMDRKLNAYLCDFGGAQTLDRLRIGGTTHDVTFSPVYAAPELLLGGAVSPAIDFYSFGCVLFEMAAGRAAFTGEFDALLAAKRSAAFDREALTERAAGPDIAALVEALLNPNPQARPGAAEIHERLQRARPRVAPRPPVALPGPDDAAESVGYERERVVVEGAVAAAMAGANRIVVIDGAAGSGKSHLIAEAGRLVDARGGFASGSADEIGDAPFTVLSRAARSVEAIAAPFEALVDSLRRAEFDETSDDHATFAAVQEALWSIVADRPLVIALDDLHWVDDASRALIDHVAHAIAASPERGGLCLMLSYRTGEAGAPLEALVEELLRASCTVRVRLRGFAENDVKNWIMRRSGVEPSRQLARRMRDATAGSPLFLGELYSHLQRNGYFTRADGHLVATVDPNDIALPRNYSAAIAIRTEALSADCSRALTVASFLGNELEERLLLLVLDWDRTRWQSIREEALASGLVQAVPAGLRFTHPLIRREFYGAPGEARRALTHYEIARRLIDLPGDAGSHPLAIAHHLVRAGQRVLRSELYHFCRIAGDHAFKLFAFGQAGAYFQAAAEAAVGREPDAVVGRLYYRAGLAYGRGSDVGPSNANLDRAIEWCARAGAAIDHALALERRLRNQFSFGEIADGQLADVKPLEAMAPLVEHQDAYLGTRMYDTLASAYLNAGRFDECEALAERALTIARRSGVEHYQCIPVTALALSNLYRFRVEKAYELWREGLERATTGGSDIYRGYHLQRLPLPLFHLGRTDEAARFARDAYTYNRGIHNDGEMTVNLSVEVMLANLRGALDEALSLGQEAIEIVRTTRYPWAAASLYPAVAQTYALLGRFDKARETVDELIEPGRTFDDVTPYRSTVRRCHWLIALAGDTGVDAVREELGDRPLGRWSPESLRPGGMSRICADVLLADALGRQDLGEALEALLFALDRKVVLTMGWSVLVPRALGLAYAVRGDSEQAVARLEAAVDTAEAIGAVVEAAHARFDLARVVARGGVSERTAEPYLDEAEAIYARCGMGVFAARCALQRAAP